MTTLADWRADDRKAFLARRAAEEAEAGTPPQEHPPDGSYAHFMQWYTQTHDLEVKPPWWEKYQNRLPQEPQPIEGPTSKIIDGFTGQQFIVPRVTDESTPVTPTVKRKPRKRREFDIMTNQWVPSRRKQAAPNMRADGRRHRRQNSRFEGMAGYTTPRSQ